MEERQKSSPKWKQYYTSYKDNGGSGMDLETSSKCSDEDGDKKTSRRRNTLVKVVEVGADAASPASPLVSAGAYSEAKSSPEGGDEEDEGYLDEI